VESKKGCTVPNVEIKGHIESIKFPRKFNCENLNMMSLDTFKFESSRLPSCKTINLSREAVENYIRKQWKIEADKIKLWN
jgi:phage FluMu protein Com